MASLCFIGKAVIWLASNMCNDYVSRAEVIYINCSVKATIIGRGNKTYIWVNWIMYYKRWGVWLILVFLLSIACDAEILCSRNKTFFLYSTLHMSYIMLWSTKSSEESHWMSMSCFQWNLGGLLVKQPTVNEFQCGRQPKGLWLWG